MKRTAMVLGIAWAALAAAGCGKSFGEPELAVKEIGKLQKARVPAQAKRALEAMEWRIKCSEKEMEWFADKGDRRKEIDEANARLEFLKDHLGEIEDSVLFEVTDIKLPDPNNQNLKEVAVKLWRYDEKAGATPKDFYLEYEASERAFKLTKTDKGWKLQKGSVKLEQLD